MKWMRWMLLLLVTSVIAQGQKQSTNSLFDQTEIKAYASGSILVQGEVQNPGSVDLSALPLRSVPVKELGFENGKQVFKGAFFVTGYSLYDILNSKVIKKAAGNTFAPPVDVYAIVENNKGEKAVFSWGELFYTDSFDVLISKTVQAINPTRSKSTWPLPEEPRLICGSDLLNVRFISTPTKITVKSFQGSFATEKPKDTYSPEIRILTKTGSVVIRDISSSVEQRKFTSVLYGHGMGFKEVLSYTGYILKDLIAASSQATPDSIKRIIAVVSAKDGYRSVLSMSELMNRSDAQDFSLMDYKDNPANGRYTLMVPGDFFADRDVKGVEKIELVNID